MTITTCIYCQLDTVGNHAGNCPAKDVNISTNIISMTKEKDVCQCKPTERIVSPPNPIRMKDGKIRKCGRCLKPLSDKFQYGNSIAEEYAKSQLKPQEGERESKFIKPMYRFVPENKNIVHAVKTRHRELGIYFADQHFGGGFSILCGIEAEGEGTLYEPNKAPEIKVTCKKCFSSIFNPQRDNQ